MTKRAFAIFALIWVFLALPLIEFVGANDGWRAVTTALLFRPTYDRDLILAALFYIPPIACVALWVRASRISDAQHK